MSETTSSSNKRIAKNTLFMYIRMIFVMAVSLFTSRIVLKSLGVVDYGIYGVVGGFVAMFSVFSNSMSAAIQRFITFELGKGNVERVKTIFSTSVTIQIIIAVSLMIAAEIIGYWFIHNKMVIPEERISAAIMVMHCSVITFGIGLISVPYNAEIIAHEKMSAFAYISIYEVLAKVLACTILYYIDADHLIVWAIMLAIIQLSVRYIYGRYCGRHFEECSYTPILDKKIFKEIFGFAGWSSFGLVALTCYTQGLDMVLNIFFGPVVNAARSIAVQVQSAVQSFSTNFQVAMNPQIIASYARNELERMHRLLFSGTRFCFFLLLFLSLPIFLETPYILSVWLGEYPEHTVGFIRLILLVITFDSSFGGPISTAQTATGKIKVYQIVVGGIMLTILPLSYLILKIWHTIPETVYIIYLCVVVVAHFARMIIIRPMIKLSLRRYFTEVIKPISRVTIAALPIPIVVYFFVNNNTFLSVLLVCVICMLSVAGSVYFLGLKNTEQLLLKDKIKVVISSVYGRTRKH